MFISNSIAVRITRYLTELVLDRKVGLNKTGTLGDRTVRETGNTYDKFERALFSI